MCCNGKVRYIKVIDVIIALKAVKRKWKDKRKDCRYYYCPKCSNYHLTTMPIQVYAKINQKKRTY